MLIFISTNYEFNKPFQFSRTHRIGNIGMRGFAIGKQRNEQQNVTIFEII